MLRKIAGTKAGKKDMELINSFAVKELSEDEVYTFTMVAADDQIDRDCEYFTAETLSELAEMFKGKPVITDHDPKTENQSARIYDAHTESDGGHTQLVVQAYALRDGSEGLISRIEAGIVKEVSVGCAVRSRTCSVCGKQFGFDGCRHRKGMEYDGKMCAVALSGAVDAYEISFVAVPAQKGAGVIKCCKAFDVGAGQAAAENKAVQDDKLHEKMALRLRLEAAKNHLKEIDKNGNEQEDV